MAHDQGMYLLGSSAELRILRDRTCRSRAFIAGEPSAFEGKKREREQRRVGNLRSVTVQARV